MKKRFLVLAATVLIGAAACGGGDGEAGGKPAGHDMPGHDMGGMSIGTAAKGDHNDQDVMFAQMMIPHHRQAVQMSKVVAAGFRRRRGQAAGCADRAGAGPRDPDHDRLAEAVGRGRAARGRMGRCPAWTTAPGCRG